LPLGLWLGLGSGLGWGTADFFGGLLARRRPALTVVFWSQLSGGSIWGLVVLLTGQPFRAENLLWGMAAGLFAAGGLTVFYRAMALGTISIVAPVTACGASIPVLVSLARGEAPSPLALAGIGVAVLGIVLVSLPDRGQSRQPADARRALALALLAAVGFGTYFVLIDQGAAAGPALPWTVVGTRVGSVPLLLAFALAIGRPPTWPGRAVLPIAAIGLLDISANGLFALASTLGNLAEVAVLGSLYPVATVLLARLVLGERLAGPQAAGVSLALVGVALIGAG
jgi:drug/metabolite transporter (DMT)-like permease